MPTSLRLFDECYSVHMRSRTFFKLGNLTIKDIALLGTFNSHALKVWNQA